jgi:hypothetical protein
MSGSKVSVDFRVNRVVFYEYQKGALEATIAQAAEKLGMSGKVVAAAIRYAGSCALLTGYMKRPVIRIHTNYV